MLVPDPESPMDTHTAPEGEQVAQTSISVEGTVPRLEGFEVGLYTPYQLVREKS